MSQMLAIEEHNGDDNLRDSPTSTGDFVLYCCQ
jgi:hypothetical protein